MRKDTKGKNRSRRDFIRNTAAASAFIIVPRHVLGGPAYVAPSDKVNIAAVGAGGKGRSDIQSVSHENIYAVCDIDDNRLAETLNQDWTASFRKPRPIETTALCWMRIPKSMRC